MSTSTTRTSTRKIVPVVGLLTAVALTAGAGSAVAAKMITGADIKNNSVTGKDIKNGSLATKDLDAATRGKLNKPDAARLRSRQRHRDRVLQHARHGLRRVHRRQGRVGGGTRWDPFDAQTSTRTTRRC